MLGRHVYRVSPSPHGGWQVAKDGEAAPRAQPPTREAALALAGDLAAADAPSKILVLEADGTLADERIFGADPGEAIET